VQINEETVKIREASAKDLALLVEMARTAFLQAFSAANKLENVMSYLDLAFTQEQFSKELSELASFFYVAEINEQIIGYTKVNLVPAQSDIHDPESLEIARLYVLEKYLGIGLGQDLLDLTINLAKAHQKKYIWLGVWEHNPRAIRFYQKNGFEKFSSHPFPFGDEVQTDWLMRKMI